MKSEGTESPSTSLTPQVYRKCLTGLFWTIRLCNPDCLGTYYVDQTGLEFSGIHLRTLCWAQLKVCGTTPSSIGYFNVIILNLFMSSSSSPSNQSPNCLFFPLLNFMLNQGSFKNTYTRNYVKFLSTILSLHNNSLINMGCVNPKSLKETSSHKLFSSAEYHGTDLKIQYCRGQDR